MGSRMQRAPAGVVWEAGQRRPSGDKRSPWPSRVSAVYFTVLGNHDWDVASRGTAQPGDPFVRSVGGRPGQ